VAQGGSSIHRGELRRAIEAWRQAHPDE
jgi:aspartate beta-hydroxylase